MTKDIDEEDKLIQEMILELYIKSAKILKKTQVACNISTNLGLGNHHLTQISLQKL